MKQAKHGRVGTGQLGAMLAAGALGVSLGCGNKDKDETAATTLTGCVSGFEKVDLAARTSTMVLNRTGAAEKGNGNVVGSKNGKFYAAVATGDATSGYKSQIQVFDVVAGTAKKFYEISDANYAAYALGYDSAANKLLVGENNTDGTGKFSVFDLAVDSSTPASTINLPLPPSKVTVVPGAGLAIASVAADYTSSTLYFQNTTAGAATGQLRTLLSGESGDPWTALINNALYFFNRSSTSSNFRKLDPGQADGAPTAQIRTEGTGLGDPHDALWLSADRVLLAHYTAGKLIVINPVDGSVKQEISADWDLGTDSLAVFRPEALYKAANATTGEIYVVNQGRNSSFSGFTGAQQLFVLKDDGVNLSVVDVDTTKAKVQGIKLNVVNPQIIDGTDDPNKPIVGGFCTIYDKTTP